MEDWKYHHYIDQLQRTTKKVHENFVVSSLFHEPLLADLMPLTQHYLRRDEVRYALVDLYYPQLHIAIEIDEPHHQKYQEQDKERQREIEQKNSCEFFRIDISKSNILEQISSLKETLLSKRALAEKNEDFSPWHKPKSATFEELQSELNSTLFVKIRGRIKEDKLLERQTGAWSMNSAKQEKVKQVVVVHDRIVSRVFRDLVWARDPNRGNKWAFKGQEIEDLDIVGSLLLGWKYQSTRVYSNDIEGRV